MRLTKRGDRMYFQIMWRFLEQKSFPLTPAEYGEQLDAVAVGARGSTWAGQKSATRGGGGVHICVRACMHVCV